MRRKMLDLHKNADLSKSKTLEIFSNKVLLRLLCADCVTKKFLSEILYTYRYRNFTRDIRERYLPVIFSTATATVRPISVIMQ